MDGLSILLGMAIGVMFTIYLADHEMSSGTVETPWSTFYCGESIK